MVRHLCDEILLVAHANMEVESDGYWMGKDGKGWLMCWYDCEVVLLVLKVVILRGIENLVVVEKRTYLCEGC